MLRSHLTHPASPCLFPSAHATEHPTCSLLTNMVLSLFSLSFNILELYFDHLVYFQFLWMFTADKGICAYRKDCKATTFCGKDFLLVWNVYTSLHISIWMDTLNLSTVRNNKNLNRVSFCFRFSLAEYN